MCYIRLKEMQIHVVYVLIAINQTLRQRDKTFSTRAEFAHFSPDTDVNKGLNTKSTQINPFVILLTGTS